MQPGNKVKCIKATSYGPYLDPSEKLFTVSKISGRYLYLEEYPSNAFLVKEFEVVPLTKEQLEKEYAELKAKTDIQLAQISAKIRFIEETGLGTYDETEFKTWHVLEELENGKLTNVERARKIAQIIKG